jgi:hypothetical protein
MKKKNSDFLYVFETRNPTLSYTGMFFVLLAVASTILIVISDAKNSYLFIPLLFGLVALECMYWGWSDRDMKDMNDNCKTVFGKTMSVKMLTLMIVLILAIAMFIGIGLIYGLVMMAIWATWWLLILPCIALWIWLNSLRFKK